MEYCEGIILIIILILIDISHQSNYMLFENLLILFLKLDIKALYSWRFGISY